MNRSIRLRGAGQTVTRAVMAAVAATIVLAFVAALIATAPGSRPGQLAAQQSQAPRRSHTPVPTRATPTPAPTGLPRFAVLGSPAPKGTLRITGGHVQLLDLSTGGLVATAGAASCTRMSPASAHLATCMRYTQEGDADLLRLILKPTSDDGSVGRALLERTYRGIRIASLPRDQQGEAVAVSPNLSRDGRWLYVGVVERDETGSRRGVEVIDVSSGRVVQRLGLGRVEFLERGSSGSPSLDKMRWAWAPSVELSSEGGSAVISGSIVRENSESVDYWGAQVRAGMLVNVQPFRRSDGLLEGGTCYHGRGLASETTFFALCEKDGGHVYRRVRLDGSLIADTRLPDVGTPLYLEHLVDAEHGNLFLWNPFAGKLFRIDLASGTIKAEASTPRESSSADRDFIDRMRTGLADWIAPPAVAKMMLHPSVVLSPDGSTLYTIGSGAPSAHELGGSTGVWVWDARSLATRGHWSAVADYVSLAVSQTGRWVYALAMPQVDAAGNPSDWGASLTVYETTTGEVRLVAGDLGENWLMFDGGPQV